MKVEYYNPKDEKGGCVYRSISVALNKNYNDVKEELANLSKALGYKDPREEKVFEEYLKQNDFTIDTSKKEQKLFLTNLDGINIAYVYYDDWYHMVCVINNIIYDKNNEEELKNLKIIKVYKKH